MANFTTEQVEVQIRNQLIREGFNLEVVNSAALQGANHYSTRPKRNNRQLHGDRQNLRKAVKEG